MTRDTHTTVEVCICTFRRPSLGRAIQSVLAQRLPGDVRNSVLVIDNDVTPSAARLVAELAKGAEVPLRYAHRPSGNISIARNGALELCKARYLAFLDDDEVAAPGWLAALVYSAQASGADVVLGPVTAVYPAETPHWIRRLDLHSTRPVHVGGEIRTGYTCNVLIDRESEAINDLRFDLSLGRSGGEDTVFFAEIHARGGHIVHAEGAIVTEDVSASRSKFSWLARRRFRMGQTHGRLLAGDSGGWIRLQQMCVASAKVTFCLGVAALRFASVPRRNAAILRGCLHLGTMTGLLGATPIELYGSTTTGATK